MGTIKIKNMTTLTDYSAIIRVGLYLSGNEKEAKENGFDFNVSSNEIGMIVTVREVKGNVEHHRNSKQVK